MSQFTAFRPMTYWLPSPAIEPISMALLPVRWQTSRVTSGVNRSPAGRPISFKRLVHLAVGNQVEKGGLLQLHRESLLQRVVEYAVAGLVVEIGEDNRVLHSEFWCAVKIEVSCDEERQHRRGSQQSITFQRFAISVVASGFALVVAVVSRQGTACSAGFPIAAWPASLTFPTGAGEGIRRARALGSNAGVATAEGCGSVFIALSSPLDTTAVTRATNR